MIQLTQKERMLLEDQKKHEELCIKKYNKYSQQAQDGELKNLFTYFSTQEQEHLNTINQILSGQVPNIQQNAASQVKTFSPGQYNQNDEELCSDALVTEKYVSGAYNTAVFEFTDTNVRKLLNHIQKEEQEHGEGIFNYMRSRNMYNPQ